MKTNFNSRLIRTKKSFYENKKFIIENNKEFLDGKSLLEFGTAAGTSLAVFSELYDQFNLKKIFYGFDSFKGLPKELLDENNPDYWFEGAFIDGSVEHLNNVLPFVIIKDGWFEDTLNDDTLGEVKTNPIGIFHIDCDIYTSSIQVLEWIVKNNLLVDGALIIYDDWGGHYDKGVGEYECGQGRAHKEICEKYRLNFEFVSCDEIVPWSSYEVCTFKYSEN